MHASEAVETSTEFTGRWWLHGAPQEVFPGVLRVSSDGSSSLEVFGSFSHVPVMQEFVVDGSAVSVADHAGSLGGTCFSLQDAFLAGESGMYDQVNQMFRAHDVLQGHEHYDAHSRVSHVHIGTARLRDWMSEATVDWSYEGARESLQVDCPEPLDIRIPSFGTVSFRYRIGRRRERQSGQLTIEPSLTISLEQSVDRAALFEEVIAPVVSFLTFVTGDPDRIRELSIGCTNSEDETTHTWIWHQMSWTGSAPKPKASWSQEHLIPFAVYRSRMAGIVAGWLKVYNEALWPIQEFLAPRLSGGSVFIEEQFSRTARALEGFHRIRHAGSMMDADTFSDLLTRVLAAANDEEEREFLAMRMKYANELTQKKRLDALIEGADSKTRAQCLRRNKFARRIVARRNALTRPAAPSGNDVDYDDLMKDTELLEQLLESHLLKACGLSNEELSDAFRRSPRSVRPIRFTGSDA